MSASATGPRHPFAHTLSRRQLLQLGGLGMLNLSLPGIVCARADAN